MSALHIQQVFFLARPIPAGPDGEPHRLGRPSLFRYPCRARPLWRSTLWCPAL